MFRFFLFTGIVIVIALFTALVAPYFVDWTSYRRDFERQASQILGQPVSVGGDANIRLLPLPSVSFTRLSVGETAEGEPMMTVDRFSANVELAPLLSGEIRVVDMRLDRPHFNMAVDENGRIDWTNRQQLLVDPSQVKLDKLTIADASFLLTGLANGQTITGDAISADVSAGSLYGPWRIGGRGRIGGQDTRFEIATGRLTEAETLRLKLTAMRDGLPYELHGDGPVSLRNSVLTWSGEFTTVPLGRQADGLRARGQEIGLPVWTHGKFELRPAELHLPEIGIEIGSRDDPFVLTGQGRADLRGEGGFRLELDGRQIDVERLAEMRGTDMGDAVSLEGRVALIRGILDQVPIPQVNGVFDFEIPAIVSGETMIREIGATIRPAGKRWRVDRLNALLPGNTTLEFTGSVGKGDDFGFDGDLLVASRQVSGLAAWLGGGAHPLVRRIKSAGLSANVTIKPAQIDLNQLEILLDGNRITGRINRLAPVANADGSMTKPALVAELKGDLIALDDLRALYLMMGQEDVVAASHDFDVSMEAGRLTGFDLAADGVNVQFQLRKGEVSISRLDAADFLGAAFTSSGQIRNVLTDASGNLKVAVTAGSLAPLLAEFTRRFGELPVIGTLAADPRLTAESKLSVEIDAGSAAGGIGNRNRYVVSGIAGGTAIDITGGFDGGLAVLAQDGFALSVSAENDDGAALLSQAGLGAFGFNPLLGGVDDPLKVNFELLGSRDKGYTTSLTANAKGTAATAQGVFYPAPGEAANFQFDVTFGSHDIAPLVSAFGYALPGLDVVSGEAVPFSVNGRLARTDHAAIDWDVSGGQIAGNRFSGKLQSRRAPDDDLAVTGTLGFDRIDLAALFAGAFGLAPSPSPDAGSSFSPEEFAGAVFANLDADIALRGAFADAGLGAPIGRYSSRARLDDGSLALTGITGDWAGGALSGQAVLQAGEAYGWQMQVEAKGVEPGEACRIAGVPQVVSGKIDFSGTFDGIGKSPRAIAGSLGGNGVVTVRGGQLSGIRQDGMEEVFAAADKEGFEIGPDTVGAVVRAVFLSGATGFSVDGAPVAVSQGLVQLRNVALVSTGKPDPVLDASYDLVGGAAQISLRMVPPAGAEALPGASSDIVYRWSGAPQAPALSLDTSALEGFLSVRAFEREQRRVEILQAALLERQRLQQDMTATRVRERWRQARLEERRRVEEEERERIRLEQEREAERLRTLEAERQAEEAAARRAAEEEAARKAAAEAAARQAEERAAAQAAAEARNSSEIKSGVEAQALPSIGPGQTLPEALPEAPTDAPAGTSGGGLFKNIEKLLFNTQ
ncbi:MAG: AsmA family protein [Nitratireductor sp.]|nr:AsmA family protein [Nitratireductor sp.]